MPKGKLHAHITKSHRPDRISEEEWLIRAKRKAAKVARQIERRLDRQAKEAMQSL